MLLRFTSLLILTVGIAAAADGPLLEGLTVPTIEQLRSQALMNALQPAKDSDTRNLLTLQAMASSAMASEKICSIPLTSIPADGAKSSMRYAKVVNNDPEMAKPAGPVCN